MRIPTTLWNWLTSIRLAVILLIAFGLALFLGLLFPSMAPEVAANAVERGHWLATARARYGPLTNALFTLGLFDVYHSAWFRVPLVLLILSTAAAAFNRVRPTWRAINLTQVWMPDSFFDRAPDRELIRGGSRAQALNVLRASLVRRRYRVVVEEEPEIIHLYADRYRFARLGSLATHAGIVLLLVAVLIGGTISWREQHLVLVPGQARAVGHGVSFQVRAEGFEMDRYPNGSPRDYRSDVTVLDGGQPVLRRTVRPNEPLQYGGVNLYLLHAEPGPRGGYQVIFSAAHDPSFGPAVAAAVLVLLGLVLSFYFPHQRVWARIEPDGTIRLAGKSNRNRIDLGEELKNLWPSPNPIL